jgi:S-adenosylmethionine/arginine decarboxylase-like enzyme
MNHQRAFHYLAQFFGSKRPEITDHKRGFIDSVGDEIPYKQEAG